MVTEMKVKFSPRSRRTIPTPGLAILAAILVVAISGCAVAPAPPAADNSAASSSDRAADGTVPREQRWSRPTVEKAPASEQDKKDEQAVLQRVLARQSALAGGRWEEAWSLLSPGARIVFTPEQVRLDHERAVLAFDKAGTVECRKGLCDAAIQSLGKITLPRLGVRQTPVVIFERWEIVEGVPYLVPKNAATR